MYGGSGASPVAQWVKNPPATQETKAFVWVPVDRRAGLRAPLHVGLVSPDVCQEPSNRDSPYRGPHPCSCAVRSPEGAEDSRSPFRHLPGSNAHAVISDPIFFLHLLKHFHGPLDFRVHYQYKPPTLTLPSPSGPPKRTLDQ